MKAIKHGFAAIAVAGVALSACVNPDGTPTKTTIGAGTGAVVGGVLGRIVADDKGDGTRNGAVAGAVVGGLIGNALDQQEKDLQNALGGTGAQIVNTGDRLVVTLPEAITFPTDSATVKSSLLAPLASLAGSINKYPNTTVQIVGHTDNTGSDAYNQALSERRAISVSSILANNGVSGARLSPVGMGERSPIATNNTDAGRQANRRVEINIIPN